MNDVYACLLIAKEAAMTLFFMVCIIALVLTWRSKDRTKKDGE